MHLAAALKIPVVAIFGPTNPARNGPFGTRSIVLRSASSMTDHTRHGEPEQGLLEITVGEVVAATRKLLQVRLRNHIEKPHLTARVEQSYLTIRVSELSQSGPQPSETTSDTWSRVARRIRVPLGFIFAVVYVWLAQPTRTSLIAGSLVLLPGLVLRGLASGHVQKDKQLTTSGPYAYTRNPLYLGSLMLAAGLPSRRAVGGSSRSCW